MQNVLLSPIPLDDLKEVFRDCIKSELAIAGRQEPPQPDEFITEEEARQLLHISKVTLKKWRDADKIPFYRFGTRIRYKKAELVATASTTKKGRARRATAQ